MGIIVFGLAFVLLPDLMLDLFNWLLYSSSPASSLFKSPTATYIIFAHRVLGAVMIGWGVSLLIIVVSLWRLENSLAWYALTFSILAWFIPDTLFSLSSGFAGNALLNLIFFVAFAIPLTATYRHFADFTKNSGLIV